MRLINGKGEKTDGNQQPLQQQQDHQYHQRETATSSVLQPVHGPINVATVDRPLLSLHGVSDEEITKCMERANNMGRRRLRRLFSFSDLRALLGDCIPNFPPAATAEIPAAAEEDGFHIVADPASLPDELSFDDAERVEPAVEPATIAGRVLNGDRERDTLVAHIWREFTGVGSTSIEP